MDCTYCVLQGYVNVPAITVFVNVEDLLEELETRWAEHPEQVWRLGTGEFGDSLALDGLMGLNEFLIPRFAGRGQAILEIKSKWPQLEHLLSLGPNPQVIFGWSLNPPEIIAGEEKFAASLESRLKAAARAVAAGFRVAFHFDPLIYFPGWEEAYQRTVERLGAAVPSQAIAWISLGGLRLLPPLRQLMLQRFPQEPHRRPRNGPGPGWQAPLFQEPPRRDVRPHAGVADPGDSGGAPLSLHGKPQGLAGGLRVYSRRAQPFPPTGWTSPAPALRAMGSSGRTCPWLCGPDFPPRGRKRAPADACVPRRPSGVLAPASA